MAETPVTPMEITMDAKFILLPVAYFVGVIVLAHFFAQPEYL